jgi:hypothetical protein
VKVKRQPQWNDWRCYRCNKWYPAEAERVSVVTPAGWPVAVCAGCKDKP